jgi:hypothetical protein
VSDNEVLAEIYPLCLFETECKNKKEAFVIYDTDNFNKLFGGNIDDCMVPAVAA